MIASIAALVLVSVHVIVSARYMHGRLAVVGYVVVCLAALALLLQPRQGAGAHGRDPGFIGRLAFGRHSRLVFAATLASAAAVALLVPGRVTLALRGAPLARSATLPLSFPHEKHNDVNCLVCHHDYADQTGFGTCVACHRSKRPDLKAGIEARFHTFCLDCHRDRQQPYRNHGPVAGCDACHQDPPAAKGPVIG